MGSNNFIERKINEESKDLRIADIIQIFINLLNAAGIPYVCIGSCSVFAHHGYAYRLPEDIDIVISSESSHKLREVFSHAGLEISEQLGFLQVIAGKFKLHIVINSLKIIDIETNKIIDDIDLLLDSKDTVERGLLFCPIERVITIRVPIVEIIFALNLLAPLNSNTFSNAIILLKKDIDIEHFSRFVNSKKMLSILLKSRIVQLMQNVQRQRITNNHEIIARLENILSAIK